MKTNSTLKRHIVYFTAICLFFILMSILFKGVCPLLAIWGIPCPTCGVTRALLSICHFDMNGYFYFHPLAIPLLLSVWSILHISLLKHKKAVYVLAFSVLILNLCLYIVRFQDLFEIVKKGI